MGGTLPSMTATFTLSRPDLFPEGTTVDVYELPASTPRPFPTASDAPGGTAADSGVVDAEGVVEFTGLTENKRHVAVGEVGFIVELLDGDGALVATVSVDKPRPFSITVLGDADEDWTGGVTFTWDSGDGVLVVGAADLSDLESFVEDNGGTLTIADGITDELVADGTYEAEYVEGAASYRRVYFRTPSGAETVNVGSTVVSYDAADAALWPSWRTRRRNLGLV